MDGSNSEFEIQKKTPFQQKLQNCRSIAVSYPIIIKKKKRCWVRTTYVRVRVRVPPYALVFLTFFSLIVDRW
jgi:hypothetical protein